MVWVRALAGADGLSARRRPMVSGISCSGDAAGLAPAGFDASGAAGSRES